MNYHTAHWESLVKLLNVARDTRAVVTVSEIADQLGFRTLPPRSWVSHQMTLLLKRGILQDLTPDRARHHKYRVLRRVPLKLPEPSVGRMAAPSSEIAATHGYRSTMERALEAPPSPDRPPAEVRVPPGSLDALVGSLARRADIEQLARVVKHNGELLDQSPLLQTLDERLIRLEEMMGYIYTELGGPR